jgi:hypothetical protein
MTRRDGAGEIKEDGGTMGDTRSRGRSIPFAFDTALLRIFDSSGLLKAHHHSLKAFLITTLVKV